MAQGIVWTITSLALIWAGTSYSEKTHGQQALFIRRDKTDDIYTPVWTNYVPSFVECGLHCLKQKHECAFVNYKEKTDVNGEMNCQILNSARKIRKDGDLKRWILYKAVLNVCDIKHNICNNGGKCIDNTSLPCGYHCECHPRYTGEHCQIKIVVESTCSNLKKKHPDAPSGIYSIDPKIVTDPETAEIYCNMTANITVSKIGHDSEAATMVDGYEGAGAYSRNISYHLKMDRIVAIINASVKCEQFIKYECFSSLMHDGTKVLSWWVSRHGDKMLYWGGADPGSAKCGCAMTNSCSSGGKCNCDENDNALREDSGYLTDKNTLPVTQLRFGDTGYTTGTNNNEYGIHTLGPLLCWG